MATLRSDSRLQNSLADILRLLERHRVLDKLAKQEGRRRDMLENLQHRQNLAELESPGRTYVEIGTSPTASNVLTSPQISSYGSPGFTTTLPPGRYYARARRLPYNCEEVSNASPEVTFVIP